MSEIVPIARCAVTVRVAKREDLEFIDSLQKQHSRQLGYFPTKQFEGYIAMGGVLIAESDGRGVGYCVSRDRYLKRDELGVIFQLCVAPGQQRKLIGAALIKAVFERSAYGCRLYCCWCAQDIEANRFWESLGFVPIAFRAGSAGKQRVHIFWQRRIHEGDVTTPYWYPCQTNAGAIREDRIVFPIPPGTHWSEVKAVVLPREETPKLEARNSKQDPKPKPQNKKRPVYAMSRSKLRFPEPKPAKAPKQKTPRQKPKGAKNDPRLVAAARELRDRSIEYFNANPSALLSAGKYDVARQLASPAPIKQLPHAA